MGELIEYLAERVQALIDLLATALLSLPLSTVLAILYAEQLICYQIILTCHETLALEGYVMPYPASLNSIAGTSLITPVLACTKYPRIKQSENHLICSPHQTELPSTIPDFHNSSADILPNQFINIAPFNLDNLKSYVDAKSPEDTRKFQEEQMINKSKGDAGIGNAVELTHWMILNSKESSLEKYVFANWNLDSDRGYAYKTWIGEIPKDDSNTVKDESWDIEN